MDPMELLEDRVATLESDVKPLLSLPTQMSMLIASSDKTVVSIEKTNACIEKLSEHMERNYVSKDIMTLTVSSAVSSVQLWSISAFFVAIATGVSTLYYVTHMVK
jgi:hypothetical protein